MRFYQAINPSLSVRLHIARAVAALLVTIGHLRSVYFFDWEHLIPDSRNPINYLLWGFTRLGHESVIVFFVLSGYLVGGSLVADISNEKPQWLRYFINRIIRMWVVLLPALIIGCICDVYTVFLNPSVDGAANLTLSTFLGNLVFLQTIKVQTFGTNMPLWSLAFEFWYYMMWPVLLFIATLKFKLYFRIGFLILITIGLYYIIPDILFLFPIWIAGALLRFVNLNKIFKNKLSLSFSILFSLACLGFSTVHLSYLADYLLGFSVLFVILHWKHEIYFIKNIGIRLPYFFSDFSFSLYATHYFFMFLVIESSRTIFNLEARHADANFLNWLIMIVIGIIVIVFSWIFYYFTERHTPIIRKRVYQVISSYKRHQFDNILE